jgi:putative membrane protein
MTIHSGEPGELSEPSIANMSQTNSSPAHLSQAPGANYPSVESRVREYLANERTYLAWMRSAISLLGFGIIIVRIRAFQPPLATGPGTTWQLGLIFSIVGLITVFLSTHHYFAIRQEIADDNYEPTGRWMILFSIIVTLLGAGIIYYVFTYSPYSLGSAIAE